MNPGEIILPWRWKARPYQKPLWSYLRSGGTRAVANWHRRSGKDETLLHHTACAAHERVGNYWYMLPEYSQARKAMWDAINPHTGKRRIDGVFPHALRKATKEQEMMIVFHSGSTFQLVGSDNFNSLVGSPPVGLVFSEYALSQPSAWSYLMPILEENKGWAAFNSTPRGKNHFKRLCEFAANEPGWFYSRVSADASGIFDEEQLQTILRALQAEHEDEEYGRAMWLQEYFCSFDAALPGSIWGAVLTRLETEGRLSVEGAPVTVTWKPDLPVYTGWDLGFDDETVAWFYQIEGTDLNIIDYEEGRFQDVEYYALMLRDKPYKYGTHWMPHDARPRTLASGGKSILQQFDQLNRDWNGRLGAFRIAPRMSLQDGIQAGRKSLRYCRFDHSTMKGTDKLKAYRRRYDEDKQTFSSEPEHDAASHPADAFRTVALTWRKAREALPEEPDLQEGILRGNVVRMPFGQIRDRHLKKMRLAREEWTG